MASTPPLFACYDQTFDQRRRSQILMELNRLVCCKSNTFSCRRPRSRHQEVGSRPRATRCPGTCHTRLGGPVLKHIPAFPTRIASNPPGRRRKGCALSLTSASFQLGRYTRSNALPLHWSTFCECFSFFFRLLRQNSSSIFQSHYHSHQNDFEN